MKTTVLLIASAAIIAAAAAFHIGHEPKCLKKLMKSEKAAESAKAETSLTFKK